MKFRDYEALLILKPDLGDEKTAEFLATIKGVLTSAGGKIHSEDLWGKRRLAYPIAKQKSGFYVLLHFATDPEALEKLYRTLRFSDLALKHLILNAKSAPPSAEREPEKNEASPVTVGASKTDAKGSDETETGRSE